jgi:hypothetical protein
MVVLAAVAVSAAGVLEARGAGSSLTLGAGSEVSLEAAVASGAARLPAALATIASML